ncbi:MAG: PadR family transcriptional regulator [Longimicrobiales bacterium]
MDVQGLGKSVNEALVLAVLGGREQHGYEIALEVERRTGGRFSFRHGTLYPILHRLEAEGWIDGEWEQVEGRRRKRYRLTRAGARRMGVEAERLSNAFDTLQAFLGEGRRRALPDAS